MVEFLYRQVLQIIPTDPNVKEVIIHTTGDGSKALNE